jgi:hypothetical protein
MTDNKDVGLKAALRSFGDIVRHKRQACRWVFRSYPRRPVSTSRRSATSKQGSMS